MRRFRTLLGAALLLLPVEGHARRVVALAPVLAEWYSEIVGEAEARKTLVGVSEYSNHPSFLKSLPTVGPYPRIQVETVFKLGPDLVLASTEYHSKDQIEQLRRLKLKVEVLPPERFEEMPAWIRDFGKRIDAPAGAQGAVERWTQARAKLTAGKTRRVFIEVQHEPLITVGGSSFLTDAFRAIGWINVFSSVPSGYPKVSVEAVVREKPDQILVLDHLGEKSDLEKSESDWRRFPFLKEPKSAAFRSLKGDDFAQCTFRLLAALAGLEKPHEP